MCWLCCLTTCYHDMRPNSVELQFVVTSVHNIIALHVYHCLIYRLPEQQGLEDICSIQHLPR